MLYFKILVGFRQYSVSGIHYIHTHIQKECRTLINISLNERQEHLGHQGNPVVLGIFVYSSLQRFMSTVNPVYKVFTT